MDAHQQGSELTISTGKRPPRPGAPTDQATRAAKNAELAARAGEMRERAAAESAAEAAGQTEEPETSPTEPRENVESVEVKLLDGRVVVLGPPKGVSLTMRIAMTLPDFARDPLRDRLARVLMSVRSIDGRTPKPIGNVVDLTTLANEVGDTGFEELHFWWNKYWGELKISDLQLLKKNLR
jgi:hypothetical protein